MFLARALNLTANGLSGSHPQKVMHNLQAEILLAYYLFASGRFLEGKYHAASAVSLGLSCSLNTIRSANSPSSTLPPAQDAIEEGERIHACWTVMVLDKAWAVVLGDDPHLDHQQQNLVVDTPWPLEMDDYGQGRLSRTAVYSNTLRKFINGLPTSDTGMSTIAMLSKASILWQQADNLARQWKPDSPTSDSRAFQDSFTTLDHLIANFRATLVPPNHIPRPTPIMTRALVVAHSIAHTATITLQSIAPLQADAAARQKRLVAATTVLNIIVSVPLQHLTFINAIMGTVWMASCQVLLDEIYALQAHQTMHGERNSLVTLLNRTIDVLSLFAGTWPILNYQISRISEACNGIQRSDS
ncbi:Zn(2)-C6 fungal-type domain-containing protein [Mycena sanguinolenta]|uniref:Zn(2)-C6 fungal-type domain-containing protein n=1 Tax=Mycena sanguinolenta TaxID=230812 RepID=A0A8H6YLX9_9AGAR|nr:Zn(2)-C6 fungal-type domain-containing protein [Mycena sanguinolenta]